MEPRHASGSQSGTGSARLTDVWRLGPSEVVALVGGGGKTSLMEALAEDYESEGARVVLTTTTKVRLPGSGGRPLVLADTVDRLVERARAAVFDRAAPSPLVGRARLPHDKVEGIPPEWVAVLRDTPGVAAVLVEADGSAGRPLKAPAAWEPVVPACATMVVAVAGLDAQGSTLDEEHVHRPELVAEMLGVPLGSPVRPRDILRTLVYGYSSRVPRGAAFMVFLNKADAYGISPELLEACAAATVEVWTGAVGARRAGCPPEPAVLRSGEARPAAVVLAAGRGTRMGGPKLLARLDGGTVLGRVLSAVAGCRGRLSQAIVVAGQGSEDVVGVSAGFDLAVNPDPAAGQAGSLRAGVDRLVGGVGLLVVLGDQPLVSAETLERVLDARDAAPRAAAVGLSVIGGSEGASGLPGGPVARVGTERVRPPVALHRSLVPQLLALEGDRGARELLERYADGLVAVPARAGEALDVDTPEGLARVRAVLRGEAPPDSLET